MKHGLFGEPLSKRRKHQFGQNTRTKVESLNDTLNEVMIEMQQILEAAARGAQAAVTDDSASQPVPTNQPWKNQLSKLLGTNPTLLPAILTAIQPLLSQLPTDFLDKLGEEVAGVVRRTPDALDPESPEFGALDFVEEALLRSSPKGRWHWLTVLAILQTEGCLDVFIRELLETTGFDQQQVLMAFAPLMQKPEFDPDWIFPDLFAGLHQSVLAPVIVDLSNFCYRQGMCDEHPAESRKSELCALLDQLASRMAEIESDPTAWSSNPDQISQMISDSVALCVSLCDTMALLEFFDSVPTIEKVNRLRHRRVRAEAAFALAKLGVESGQKDLLALVDEPVSRMRVLNYADELGISNQIDDKFRTPVALAESELALWLSQPNQMGVPPTVIELAEHRNLYWPSYDEPMDCYLFRFEYRLGENTFSNLAIVGPLIHAFLADLQILDQEDVFAAFAGWQVEHDEIFELDLNSLSPHRKTDLFKLERRLHDFGAEKIEPKILAVFFGEIVAIASCTIEENDCLAFVDGNQVRHFPVVGDRPIDASLVLAIYIGNKLIDAFNA